MRSCTWLQQASQPPCAISCVKFITLPWWLASNLIYKYLWVSVCLSVEIEKKAFAAFSALTFYHPIIFRQPAIQSLTSHPLPLSLDVVFLARNSDLISQLDLIRERIIDVLHCVCWIKIYGYVYVLGSWRGAAAIHHCHYHRPASSDQQWTPSSKLKQGRARRSRRGRRRWWVGGWFLGRGCFWWTS